MKFAEEWLKELAGEAPSVLADHPNYTLPIIFSRAHIQALMATLIPLGSLALRTLYSSGMRPQELLDLRSTQLTGDGHVELADLGISEKAATRPVAMLTTANGNLLLGENSSSIFVISGSGQGASWSYKDKGNMGLNHFSPAIRRKGDLYEEKRSGLGVYVGPVFRSPRHGIRGTARRPERHSASRYGRPDWHSSGEFRQPAQWRHDHNGVM